MYQNNSNNNNAFLEDLYILWNKHNWNCNRTWEEYKSGFGKIHSDTGYWIGLEILHQITNPPVKLHVFCDYDGKGWNLDYDNFTVSSEKDSYRLNVDYRQGKKNCKIYCGWISTFHYFVLVYSQFKLIYRVIIEVTRHGRIFL